MKPVNYGSKVLKCNHVFKGYGNSCFAVRGTRKFGSLWTYMLSTIALYKVVSSYICLKLHVTYSLKSHSLFIVCKTITFNFSWSHITGFSNCHNLLLILEFKWRMYLLKSGLKTLSSWRNLSCKVWCTIAITNIQSDFNVKAASFMTFICVINQLFSQIHIFSHMRKPYISLDFHTLLPCKSDQS